LLGWVLFVLLSSLLVWIRNQKVAGSLATASDQVHTAGGQDFAENGAESIGYHLRRTRWFAMVSVRYPLELALDQADGDGGLARALRTDLMVYGRIAPIQVACGTWC
jgi:hypothetical protein